MRDVLPEIEHWLQAGQPMAIATVVQVHGSGLRPMGSKLVVSAKGDIAGSVSGGCVEGAVVEEARLAMKDGRPRLLDYGITNEAAWEVGLACGGRIQVFIEALNWQAGNNPVAEIYPALLRCLDQAQLVAQATIIAGPGLGSKLLVWPNGQILGSLGAADLNAQASALAADQMSIYESGRATIGPGSDMSDIFIEVFPPQSRLIIVGAVHMAIPLVTFAKTLLFRTIVVDPRSAFATQERFHHADELMVEWPDVALEKLKLDEASFVVVITHDDKIDFPALQAALASPARYIGILGSKATHAKRVQALKELGLTDEQLAHLHAPIGLDIGAIGQEEIALSIMAEVVAVLHGRVSRQPRLKSINSTLAPGVSVEGGAGNTPE